MATSAVIAAFSTAPIMATYLAAQKLQIDSNWHNDKSGEDSGAHAEGNQLRQGIAVAEAFAKTLQAFREI